MKAFITGSHAYGIPNDKSDIDLVMFVDKKTAEKLDNELIRDEGDSETIPKGSVYIRYGKLNIIACWDEDIYRIWKDGTSLLTLNAPVSREVAKKTFARLKLTELRKKKVVK